jgi:hypothetical protein
MPHRPSVRILLPCLALASLASLAARAVELPSFLQAGDAFCTNQLDFDDYAAHGHVRRNSALETCQQIIKPTRVAIIGGHGGTKSMVRVMNGPYAYEVGWTNGKLPLVAGKP